MRSWLKRVGTKRLPLLLRRWDDLSDDQRLRLVDLAFRYSGLTSAQVAPSDEIRARMSRTMRVFQPFVPPAEYPQVLRSVLAIWEGI